MHVNMTSCPTHTKTKVLFHVYAHCYEIIIIIIQTIMEVGLTASVLVQSVKRKGEHLNETLR